MLERRLENVINNSGRELIWFLEHKEIFTAGTSFNKSEILDNSINLVKTISRWKNNFSLSGTTYMLLVLDLKKRNKDIRKFIISIENSIIDTFKEFNIITKSDRKNIGIWINHDNELRKLLL